MKTSNRMSALCITVLLTLVLTLSQFNGFSQTDFSGKWTLNSAKSELNSERSRAAKALNISQKENSLIVEKTNEFNGQERTMTDNYTLDGKECINTGFRNTEKKSTLSWSDDKKAITINSSMVVERDGQKSLRKSIEVITLSEDKNTLTIQYSSNSSRGDVTEKQVYDKVKE